MCFVFVLVLGCCFSCVMVCEKNNKQGLVERVWRLVAIKRVLFLQFIDVGG